MRAHKNLPMTHDSEEPTSGGMSPIQLALIALVGFGPLVAQFLFNLWQFDTYQFFPLALAGAAVLAKRGLDEVSRPLEPGSGLLTFPLMLGVLGLLGTAAVVVRSGEALRITDRRGRRLSVTVDHAAGGVEVIRSLLGRAAESSGGGR